MSRAYECSTLGSRRGDEWGVAMVCLRLEDFKEAAKAMRAVIDGTRETDLGKKRKVDTSGRIELEYARVMKELGDEAAAAEAVAEHERRWKAALARPMPPDGKARYRMQQLRTSVANYAASRARVAEIETALAAESTPARLRELAGLCRPGSMKAVLPLRWLKTLLRLVEEHPDSQAVRTGAAHRELYDAYAYQELHEACVEVMRSAKGMTAESPKGQSGKKSKNKMKGLQEGERLWRIALAYERLGDLRAAQAKQGSPAYREKALDAYRAALAGYDEFDGATPAGHAYKKPRRPKGGGTKPPLLKTRRASVNQSMKRLSNK